MWERLDFWASGKSLAMTRSLRPRMNAEMKRNEIASSAFMVSSRVAPLARFWAGYHSIVLSSIRVTVEAKSNRTASSV
jgi:hypothetical protein